jgi:pimeloyl-ACP methyl ester carboxylesterase
MSGSPVAGLACGTMCLLRQPLTSLAPRVAARVSPDIPSDVARDAVRYVWPAYRDALTSLLQDSPLPSWLADPPLPTTVVIAEDDQTVLAGDLDGLLGPEVEVVRLPGTHGLPLERPAEVARAILRHGNTPAPSALS